MEKVLEFPRIPYIDPTIEHNNNERLLKEQVKANQILKFFNGCADRCQLTYTEGGIWGEKTPDVICFTNCVSKANQLANELI